MAAAYITATDVNAAITSAVRADLFVDDSGDAFFDDLVQKASELVKSAAHNAGYITLGDTTTSQQIKMATLGQFLMLAYNRKQQALPEAFYEAYNMLERIRNGAIELTDFDASTTSGIGGAAFTETNSSVTGARYNVFSRSKLDVY